MIKLVACDLDGTLFNSNMVVSAENAQAIKDAQKSGIEFLVATGRAPFESKGLLKDADIHTGFINLNGALVYNQQGQLMVKHALPKTKAKALIQALRANDFYLEILTVDHVYSEDISRRIANVAHLMVDLNPGISFRQAVAISAANKSIVNITQVDNFDQLLADPQTEIMKIIAFDARGPVAFTDMIKRIHKMGGLVVTSSSATNIEINAKQAQKGIALLDYAKLRHLKVNEVAAIGDNLNDQSMIKMAGTGVAMGNAIPLIKKLAQVTTKSNNENGVAYILRKFIRDNQQEQR